MKFEDKHRVYFLGIGGIGMSALARWFKAGGKPVAGYDRTETALTRKLSTEGIEINYGDTVDAIPESFRPDPSGTLVIYTPALPADSHQLNYFRVNGFPVFKRSQVLGAIANEYFTVAVSGTHGKTTTSALIAHTFRTADRKMVAFLGGILQNYDSNLVMNLEGSGDMTVIAEADEYDRSFLNLSPSVAVVTAADPDHLDIYGTVESMREAYGKFIECIRPGGKLFIKKGIPGLLPHRERPDVAIMEYNLDHSPIRAQQITMDREELRFDFIGPGIEINNIPLCQPGYHNVENAIAAIAVSLSCGISEGAIKEAFSTYRGVKRRFEYVIAKPAITFIDDYAHHPAEIRAFLSSVRALYPDRKITAVFQPHLFSRTRDLAGEFAGSLSLADEVILLEIYPARELPIPGVTAELIYRHIQGPEKLLCKKDELTGILQARELDVLTTIGAGDIDKMVEPIKKMLLNRS